MSGQRHIALEGQGEATLAARAGGRPKAKAPDYLIAVATYPATTVVSVQAGERILDMYWPGMEPVAAAAALAVMNLGDHGAVMLQQAIADPGKGASIVLVSGEPATSWDVGGHCAVALRLGEDFVGAAWRLPAGAAQEAAGDAEAMPGTRAARLDAIEVTALGSTAP